jgi:hypothetical protein
LRFSPPRSPQNNVHGFTMKHCPACNSTFPDFHRVCDFDETQLVPQPDRPSIYGPFRPSRLRRVLKSPKFLTSLAVLALFAASVFIGHLASPIQTVPSVRIQPSPDTAGAQPVAHVAQPNAQTKKNVRWTGDTIDSNRLAKRAAVSRRQARLRHRSVTDNKEPQVARRKDAQSKDNDGDPKLVAVLKTTWRVLKKPFRF